jgi:hypothetical protein
MNPIVTIATDAQPIAAFAQLQQTGTAVTTLPLGDSATLLMMCSDGQMLAVRYCTARELLSQIRDHALLPAMLQLRERSAWAYLIVAGELRHATTGKTLVSNGDSAGHATTGYSWNALQGALLSVQESGVHIIQIGRESDLATTLQTLAARSRSTAKVRPMRDMLFVQPAEDLLLSIPGIGDATCERLLRFTGGSAGRALDCLTQPECDIPDVPAKIKHATRAALGLKDHEYLAVVPVEIADMTFVRNE